MTNQVPHFYYSTDASAPQIIGGQPQTVLNVLQTCLVGTGGVAYGSLASAGWTAPYTDTTNHAIVLQQGGGQNRCLSLSSPTCVNPGNGNYGLYYFLARGYNSMSAVTTGTNPFPTTAQQSLWYWLFASQYAASTTSTTVIPWRIAADDTFFYFCLNTSAAGISSYGSAAGHFFGDLYSYMNSDTCQTVISGWYNNSTNVNTAGSPVVSTQSAQSYEPFRSMTSSTNMDNNCYIYSDSASVYNPEPANVVWLYPGCQSSGWTGAAGYPNPSQNGNFMFTTAYMGTYNASTGMINMRGELPGCVFPMHSTPFPDVYQFALGSDNYVEWNQSGNGFGAQQTWYWTIALDMTSWKQN